MLKYAQTGEGKPRNVLVTTDDGDAEMAAIETMIAETEFDGSPFDQSFREAKRDADGMFEFTIPGNMVGEVAEVIYDIDNGALENLIEQWNDEALGDAEALK